MLRIRGRHPFRAEFCNLSGTEVSREIAVYHRTEVRLTRNNSSMSVAEVTPSINASLDASAYMTATLTAAVNGHKQSRIVELLP